MRELSLKQAELSEASAEILGRGGLFSFKAHGSSMYPFIRDGDFLTVQPLEINTLNAGDVVFYRYAGHRLVAHRVIRKSFRNGKCLLTIRGDSGLDIGEQAPADQVLGRVISIQRGQKVIQFDNKCRKLAAHLWITFYPLSALFLRAVIRFKRVAGFFR